MDYCDKAYRELAELLGDNAIINAHVPNEECTISIIRPDAQEALSDKNLHFLYDVGSIFIMENPNNIRGGDVVVPMDKTGEKANQINNTKGCKVEEEHVYDGTNKRKDLNVSHIHFICNPAPKIDKLIEILTG